MDLALINWVYIRVFFGAEDSLNLWVLDETATSTQVIPMLLAGTGNQGYTTS